MKRAAAILSAVPSASAFAPERGQLHADGRVIRRADGTAWGHRGMTMFAMPAHARAGHDLSRTLAWMYLTGVNVPRVFPDWTLDGTNHAFDDPAYGEFVYTYLGFMRDHGFRCKVVPISDFNRRWDDMRRILSLVYEIVGTDRFHVVEDVNEPWNNGLDVPALMQGINTNGVLSAYGVCPVNGPGGVNYQTVQHKELITPHFPRDRAHYFRNSKDLQELWPLNCFGSSDEPLGIADYDKEGSGARSTNLKDHVWHHTIARFYGGSTIHVQCGLEGRAPNDNEPITASIVAAIAEMWAAVPDDCCTGEYSRNGFPTFPFAVSGDEAPDPNHPGTGYASIHGDTAYVVVPKAVDGYTPRLANGWTHAVAIGPRDCAIYRVTR